MVVAGKVSSLAKVRAQWLQDLKGHIARATFVAQQVAYDSRSEVCVQEPHNLGNIVALHVFEFLRSFSQLRDPGSLPNESIKLACCIRELEKQTVDVFWHIPVVLSVVCQRHFSIALVRTASFRSCCV